MKNRTIELHDSTVSGVQERTGFIEILLDTAYIHESEGRPGIDSGTGWTQCVRLIFHSPVIAGVWPAFPRDIWTGSLEVGRTVYENGIPLPVYTSAPAKLALVFVSGEEVVVSGSRMDIETVGEANYVEQFHALTSESHETTSEPPSGMEPRCRARTDHEE